MEDQNNKSLKRKNSNEEDNSSKRTKKDEDNVLEDVMSGFQQISVKRKAEDSLENPIKLRKLDDGGVPKLKDLILNKMRDPEVFQEIIKNSNDDSLLKLADTFHEFNNPIKNNKSLWIQSVVNLGEYKNAWRRVLERKSLKDIVFLASDVQEFFKTGELDRKLDIDFDPFILNLESRGGNVSIKVCLPNKFANMHKLFMF